MSSVEIHSINDVAQRKFFVFSGYALHSFTFLYYISDCLLWTSTTHYINNTFRLEFRFWCQLDIHSIDDGCTKEVLWVSWICSAFIILYYMCDSLTWGPPQSHMQRESLSICIVCLCNPIGLWILRSVVYFCCGKSNPDDIWAGLLHL